MSRLTELRARMERKYDVESQDERDLSQRAVVVLMHRLMEVIQPQVCLEVGAHEASFSIRCADLLPDSRVIALEANPDVWQQHVGDISSQAPAVDYRNLAAWNTTGVVDLLRRRDVLPTRGDHSLLYRLAEVTDGYERVSVPARTIDSIVEDACMDLDEDPEYLRTALWIDVEGATRQVLEGAEKTLRSTWALTVELERVPFWKGAALDEEIDEILKGAGLEPVLEDVGDLRQRNVVYVLDSAARAVTELVEEHSVLEMEDDDGLAD
jgi:FkbM family methyltransferase